MHEDPQLRRKLLRLTVPIFLETLLIVSLGLVDIIMLSRLSDNSVAAVGLDNQILNMLLLIFMVCTVGTTAVCAQYVGARQEENFARTAAVALLFNILVGLLVSSCVGFAPDVLLTMMNVRQDIMSEASIYLFWTGSFLFLQASSITLSAILRSHNLATYPLYVSIVVNIANVLGNYALIFGKWGCPEMGVEGAAIATVVSRGVSVVLLLWALCYKGTNLFSLALFRPFPWDKLRHILKIGVPGAGEMLYYSISQIVITYFINMLGNEALAARTYVVNIVVFSFIFALALGQSGAICVGQLVGGGHNRAARFLGIYCIRLAIVTSCTISLLTACAGRWIVPLLTSNPQIIKMCLWVLWVDIAVEAGRAVNILTGRMLCSVGNPLYPLVVGVTFMWGAATLGSYVLGIALGYGLVGMWCAFALDETCRATLQGRRWVSGKWENRGVVQRHVP